MRKIVSRPDPTVLPSLSLPVHIRSTGYNEAEPGWHEHESRSGKPFVQLFWCIQGTGEFRIGRRIVLLHPGEAIYQLPGEEHVHRSVDSTVPWHYYWFTFDGPGARKFMLDYGYPQTALPAGECPVQLFRELESLLHTWTPYSQRHALSVAAEILALAGNNAGPAGEHDLCRAFIDAVQKRFPDSSITAESLAEELGVHRTTLNRIVKRQMSVSPKHYVNSQRLSRALALLAETRKSVKEIASMCGFNKTDYFCAQVRKSTGLTPAKYRKHASADSV